MMIGKNPRNSGVPGGLGAHDNPDLQVFTRPVLIILETSVKISNDLPLKNQQQSTKVMHMGCKIYNLGNKNGIPR